MSPFVLRRSPLFWIGLAGLLFLGWLWIDSMEHEKYLGRRFSLRGPGTEAVAQSEAVIGGGAVRLDYPHIAELPEGYSAVFGKFEFERPHLFRAFPPENEWFPRPRIGKIQWAHTGRAKVLAYYADLPLWMIAGVYLVMWALLIVCRWRVTLAKWRRSTISA